MDTKESLLKFDGTTASENLMLIGDCLYTESQYNEMNTAGHFGKRQQRKQFVVTHEHTWIWKLGYCRMSGGYWALYHTNDRYETVS